MPGIGGGNPIPLELGGGLSSTEKIYQLLTEAVGIGGAAADGTIEAEWRMARARGLRAGNNSARAVNQGWPHLATDFIEVYESLFKLVPGNLSDEERRQVIVDRWVRSIDASGPGVEADLQAIDPLFSVIETDRDTAATTVHGRGFEDDDPEDADACGPAFEGGRSSTAWPNYSTDFKAFVRYNLASGQFTAEAKRRLNRAKDILGEVLPGWVDWVIFTGAPGFYLDLSPLDVTAFGS